MWLAVLDKTWMLQPKKQQLYGHLPTILQIIQDVQKIQGTEEVKTNS